MLVSSADGKYKRTGLVQRVAPPGRCCFCVAAELQDSLLVGAAAQKGRVVCRLCPDAQCSDPSLAACCVVGLQHGRCCLALAVGSGVLKSSATNHTTFQYQSRWKVLSMQSCLCCVSKLSSKDSSLLGNLSSWVTPLEHHSHS